MLERVRDRPNPSYETVHGGYTAFHVAITHGVLECAQVLLDTGVDINYQTKVHGRTALMIASRVHNLKSVQYLLKKIQVFTHFDFKKVCKIFVKIQHHSLL